MAAILCKPIGECLTFVCTAPCKLCAGGCKICSEGLSGFCKNPLSAFVTVTFLTQFPLVVAAAFEIPGLFTGCKGSQWLVGMLLCAICHMVASVYLAHRITNKNDEALRNKHTSWQRVSYLLCHDCWIAIYLLVVIFFCVWLIVGSSWAIGRQMSGGCGNDPANYVGTVLGLGWTHLLLGPAVLGCNLCCSCCDKTDYAASTDEGYVSQQAMQQSGTAQNQQKPPPTYSTSGDIENNITPEPPRKSSTPPPRTYSADGVPLPDDGNAHVVEAEVLAADLPPPMAPPSKSDVAAARSNAGEMARAKAGEAAAKAQAKADKAVKSIGGWLNSKTKTKKGSETKLPDQKASVY